MPLMYPEVGTHKGFFHTTCLRWEKRQTMAAYSELSLTTTKINANVERGKKERNKCYLMCALAVVQGKSIPIRGAAQH